MFFSRILLATAAVGLGVLFSNHHSSREAVATPLDIPSCSDVVQIFSWSQKKHGFAEPNTHSPWLAKKVAVLFSEQLDPNHILFIEKEVQDLVQQTSKNWNGLLQQKDCGIFQSWANQHLNSAKKRLDLKISNWAKSSSKKKPAKYASFATDLKELDLRQIAFLESVSLPNNSVLLLKKQVEEMLFPELLQPQTVLVKAMLGALDPYSTYFLDSEFSDFYEELSGRTAGVGITVEASLRGLVITEVTSKSPADLAGIQSGDHIIEVDGKSLLSMSFRQATQLLKGDDQTEIALTLENSTGRFEKTLKRTTQVFEDKKVATVKTKKQQNKTVALISIPSFYGRGGLGSQDNEERSSSEDLKNQIEKLQQEGPLSALILDLRGNPGGYLEEAVTMAGFFLGSKVVVGVKDREEMKTLKSDSMSQPLYTGPLLVWVDEETASAGEVLAAALKDHQRALLVGSRATFGKGSVQKLIRLNDPFLNLNLEKATGVVKLTTSVFFSPLGHSPANGGVKPHILLASQKKHLMEGGAKTPALKIKDVSPLLEADQLKEIKENELTVQSVVSQIQESESEEKTTDIAKVFEIADQISKISSF